MMDLKKPLDAKDMKKAPKKSLEELAVEKGLVTPEQLQELIQKVLKERKNLEQLLIEAGVPEEKVTAALAESLGYEFLDVTTTTMQSDLMKIIKPAYAKHLKVLPLKFQEPVLTVAMVEPRDLMALDEITRFCKDARFTVRTVKVVVTTQAKLFAGIDKFYGLAKDKGKGKEDLGLGSLLDTVAETMRMEVEMAELAQEEATENSQPIVLLANRIVEEAVGRRASDIHLEPSLYNLRVRYRVDGDLAEVMRVPKYAQDAIITRFKIMADLRIDEKRVPQDGRVDFTKYNSSFEIDLRVSTVPTPFGEDVVMRILDKSGNVLTLDMLGLNDHCMKLYGEAIKSPYGILLHVGPTGSGKSTALFAALKTLDTPDVKIVTAEDPVETTLGGQIIQSSVNPATNYTFAKALKAFMRHDPDIILIGEIRDLETAKSAVEASLTGHMVFSTLHTNDAVGTVTRLIEMGVEPYLIADSLVLVCAQRLARRICSKCKESYEATKEEEELSKGDIKAGTTLYRGKGCEACDDSGERGRTGIYEVMLINKEFRNLLIKGGQTDELRRAAINSGMMTLRQEAIDKALKGVISLNQVLENTLAEST
ncbi:MAG TPA: type II/IV secretion system protein [Nitrospiraceae bacterium]|nr:type II/IV secretion system protein [Nitrospiraceae bacterium]HCL81873.1 type II/IV secretion system protein [Nitrospiraceae bacterium]HCZ11046.1 type II/IV secretion system protein [Nitrospiraceae bacterium]